MELLFGDKMKYKKKLSRDSVLEYIMKGSCYILRKSDESLSLYHREGSLFFPIIIILGLHFLGLFIFSSNKDLKNNELNKK